MNVNKSARRDLYYTNDHEWVDFQGSIAFTGVCLFKLLGFKQVHELTFMEKSGLKKRGDVIAVIKYNDYRIEVHMPVDGRIIHVNDELLLSNPNMILRHAENTAWIAQIVPVQPYERKNLLLPKQYQMNGKSKYAK